MRSIFAKMLTTLTEGANRFLAFTVEHLIQLTLKITPTEEGAIVGYRR